jgi:C_GCAxxG_C_C family probable redox protein
MDNIERAVACFKEGFNCSQSVIATYGPEFGLDRRSAADVALAFGGGIAHTGQTCGAATGALMVIGLAVARKGLPLPEAKKKAYALGGEFLARFRALLGSTDCLTLIGCRLDTPEGMKQAVEKGLFRTVCPKLIRAAAEILEELLKPEGTPA